jgi:hypothetical protein
MKEMRKLTQGDRVRDRKWKGECIGTVVRTRTTKNGRRVFVQWDDCCVEDELFENEVALLTAEGKILRSQVLPVGKNAPFGVFGLAQDKATFRISKSNGQDETIKGG